MTHPLRDFGESDAPVLFAFEQSLAAVRARAAGGESLWRRIEHQLLFAARLTQLYPDRRDAWFQLLSDVAKRFVDRVEGGADLAGAVREAEDALGEIAPLAKRLTMHLVGHAHIDMNWMWDWPETIEVCRNTFWTMDALMEEFPFFRFSQDQVSIYAALEELEPELFERIKARIRSGQWEVTANTWVEADKNLSGGEALVRQILMARDYVRRRLGVDMSDAAVDWEPDLFGHPATTPQLLRRAGIRWYYFCRGGSSNPHHRLFWWEGLDGSRVLAWNDERLWYLGPVRPEASWEAVDLAATTGVTHYLHVYGVGDHGGGPTRRDLRLIEDMQEWPVFPVVRCSTTREFFRAVEEQLQELEANGPRLPVFAGELNTVFEGCYTSQAHIKRANRRDEHLLGVAERTAAVVELAGYAGALGDHWRGLLARAWPHVLFNQFHDILPGSGVPATVHFALGASQHVAAMGEAVIDQALRRMAREVDTAAAVRGAPGECRLEMIWNPSPWPRRQGVVLRYWNPPQETTHVAVHDERGQPLVCQTLGRGVDWDQAYIDVAFVADLPPMGYRVFRLTPLSEKGFRRWQAQNGLPGPTRSDRVYTAVGRNADWAAVLWPDTAQRPGRGDDRAAGAWLLPGGTAVLENEFLRIEVEPASGAIVRWTDKDTGRERLQGGRLGLLEVWQENPHPMSAWEIGSIAAIETLMEGGDLELVEKGPAVSCVRSSRRFGRHRRSRATVEYRLWAGSPRVEVHVDIDWREEGGEDRTSPFLRMRFDTGETGRPLVCDVPFGAVSRADDGREVPAQKWVQYGWLTLANDGRYGFSARDGSLWLSVLRASYDPDPLPDQGRHRLNLTLAADLAGPGEAARLGYELNEPCITHPVESHAGSLPPAGSFLSASGDGNVVVSAVKPALDGRDWILRLYETEGRPGTARVELSLPEGCQGGMPEVREADLLESPGAPAGLEVTLGPWEIKTLRLISPPG